MSDSAQIYMENVFHITGYLHRLLFLMKELDFKENQINKLIQEKEEIYLANLNHLSRNQIDRQGTYLTGQSSLQNEEILPEFEKQNCETECDQLNGRSNQGDVNPSGDREVPIKEEEHSDGEDPSGSGAPLADVDPPRDSNPTVEEPSNNCQPNDPTDAGSESSLKGTSQKAAQREGNSHHPRSHRKKTAARIKTGSRGNPQDVPTDGLHLEGKTNRAGRTPVEGKGIKQEIPTDDEQKGEAEKEEDNIPNNVANHHTNPNDTPCEEPASPAPKRGTHLPPPQTYKKRNSNQHIPSANTDDQEKSPVCKPIQIYTEEQLENLLNEIISDREQCIALLKEKICINNQISYLIKTDFDRVKSQHDKLFVEMEMNGESPPYLHNTSRNRNGPSEWNNQDNVHQRSGFPHDQLASHVHGNDIHGSGAHGSGMHAKANRNRNTHQFNPYDMEKTKDDDADSSSIKAFGRKHSQKYDEDYTPYTVGKNKKMRKSKKSRGGENAADKANAATKLKTLPDKGASGVGANVSGISEPAVQSVGQGAGQNASESGSNQMRIRLLSVKTLSQEEAPLAVQTDKPDDAPSEAVAPAGVEVDPRLSTSEAKADVGK
ncbi:hypothetical protein C922_04670 [Plasmodium inui San Antonio 1]|uniref:Inhibitor of growth protein N-terminal histone-binding domain-containing protein n=1 Tax=Plasmodium inui San Antonio 1 TaxID=1237626 RepID=W7A079_9APIC|nr:hypothetical protein C922_04670 [Plasmodium inui San Antonio 1]EUD64938.1 hypothetical protein C922_04670 [Plasmodium inui San Antonio 1]